MIRRVSLKTSRDKRIVALAKRRRARNDMGLVKWITNTRIHTSVLKAISIINGIGKSPYKSDSYLARE
jgi:hypothetical protein